MCCARLAGNAGPKISPKIAIWTPSHKFVGLYLRNWGTYRQSEKKLVKQRYLPTCPYNIVNVGLLAAEILSLVWGTPANFNRFRVLASLLHDTLVLGASETLRRWTEGATYIWQGGHHVGHWSTFWFLLILFLLFARAVRGAFDGVRLKALCKRT